MPTYRPPQPDLDAISSLFDDSISSLNPSLDPFVFTYDVDSPTTTPVSDHVVNEPGSSEPTPQNDTQLPECFFCGTNWQATRNGTDFRYPCPPGSSNECAGCREGRRRQTTTNSLRIVVIQHTTQPWNPAVYSECNVVVCSACVNTLQGIHDDFYTCAGGCGRVVIDPDSPAFVRASATRNMYEGLTNFTISYDNRPHHRFVVGAVIRPGGIERAPVRSRGIQLSFAPTSESDLGSDYYYCPTCWANRICGDCGSHGDVTSRCTRCNITQLCLDCHDAHYECQTPDRHPSNTVDQVRRTWEPRSHLRTALYQESRPGHTILSTRAIGVEMETAGGDCRQVVAAEANAVIPVLAAVGTDASVRGRDPVEFRLLPARGWMAEYAIRSMMQWCRDAGYTPGTSAGIHMHVDLRYASVSDVWRSYVALAILEDVFFALAAPGRNTTGYCDATSPDGRVAALQVALRAISTQQDWVAWDAISGSRYRAINLHSWNSHNTIEIRVFDSCHDENEVVRYLDAAALIAGAVDFAMSAEFDAFIADRTPADLVTSAPGLLGALQEHRHITSETMARVLQRMAARGSFDYTLAA